jgi:hypothetical protein
MRRTIVLLTVAALLVVVMAATVSPALATHNGKEHYGWGTGPGYGWGSDVDGDGVKYGWDNCPTVANPAQTDTDGDGVGDACE